MVWGCTAAAAAAALAAVAVAALRRIRLARLLRHWRCALRCDPDSDILKMDETISLIPRRGMGVRPVAGHARLDLSNNHVNASADNLRQVLPASLAGGPGGGTEWARHRHVTKRGPHWGRCLHDVARRWRLRHWRDEGGWRRRSRFRPGLGLHPADVGTVLRAIPACEKR